jgi:DNA-binding GntR family transcriptional regulator
MPTRPAHRRQIVADIIEKINDGTYPPGSKLPPDRELADRYQCSLTPVKYAMDELSIRGYVVRQQGKGTVVTDHPPSDRAG